MSCNHKINNQSPTYLPFTIACSKHFVIVLREIANTPCLKTNTDLSTWIKHLCSMCESVMDFIDPQREVLFTCTPFLFWRILCSWIQLSINDILAGLMLNDLWSYPRLAIWRLVLRLPWNEPPPDKLPSAFVKKCYACLCAALQKSEVVIFTIWWFWKHHHSMWKSVEATFTADYIHYTFWPIKLHWQVLSSLRMTWTRVKMSLKPSAEWVNVW